MKYSHHSMIATVLRKSLTGTMGGNAVAAMGGFDMSRQVVCRAEVTAATCLALHAQNFHKLENGHGMMVVRTEQDATNTQIWKTSKLMTFIRDTTAVDSEKQIAMENMMEQNKHAAT